MILITLANTRIFAYKKVASVLIFLLLSGYSTIFAQHDLPLEVKNLFSAVDSLKRNNQSAEGIILLNSWIEKATIKEAGSSFTMGEAHYTLADLLKFSNRNRESIANALKAAEYYNNSGLLAMMADCYSLIGENHIYLGNYEEAISYFNKAFEIDESLGNKINLAVILNSIGKAYELCKEFDKALEFFNKSLEIAREQNQPNMIAVRLSSIASIYKNQNKLDKALELLYEALEIEIVQNNIIRKGYRLDMIGEVYTLKKDFIKAGNYLNEALEIFRANSVKPSEAIVLNHLAYNAFQRGQMTQATEYYHQSLEIAGAISFRNMLEKNHQELSRLYEQTANYQSALKHYQTYISLRDSSVTKRTREQLLDFQVRYETQEREKELAILNQERSLQELQLQKARLQRFIIIGVLVISLLLLFALYGRFLIRKRSQEELTILNAQLNELNSTKDKLFSIIAHDLRNNVSAFSNLVSNINRSIDAMTVEDLKYYLLGLQTSAGNLKNMLKNLLEWALSQQDKIKILPSEIEPDELINGLKTEFQTQLQARNIEIDCRVGPGIRIITDRNIIQTVLRNIFSNSIKYSPDNSRIEITSDQLNGNINLIIRDYGTGMEMEVVESIMKMQPVRSKPGINGESGTGLGLKLSMELMTRLAGKIEISSQPGKGSTFIIQIPHSHGG